MKRQKNILSYELCGNIYLNITNRCTAKCVFCRRNNPPDLKNPPYLTSNKPVFGFNLQLSNEPNVEDILIELENYNLSKSNQIVFAGLGEPLIRLDMVLNLARILTNRGIYTRLTTNGHAKYLYPKRNVADDLAKNGIKMISISLNAHDETTYNQLCKPIFNHAYSQMLEFAREVSRCGMDLRFTVVDIPQVNKEKCRQIAYDYDADFMIRPIS
ncbi:MAG: TatD family nuclease-associated radical SAM protein [Methanoregula sp.]